MAGNKLEEMEEIEKKEDGIVEDLSPELLIKHPLQNMWTLWYYENDRTKSWEQNQKKITSFGTAEDFWRHQLFILWWLYHLLTTPGGPHLPLVNRFIGPSREDCKQIISSLHHLEDVFTCHDSLYNHIKMASELRQGSDYSLFKEGICPMWEDDANKRGGRWLISLDKKQRSNDLDKFWLEVLLCLIGEAFDEYSEDLCGAVVNVRAKGDKIGVWTADAGKQESVLEIGRKLKARLNLGRNVQICYQIHKDTMAKAGSVTKNTYTL